MQVTLVSVNSTTYCDVKIRACVRTKTNIIILCFTLCSKLKTDEKVEKSIVSFTELPGFFRRAVVALSIFRLPFPCIWLYLFKFEKMSGKLIS